MTVVSMLLSAIPSVAQTLRGDFNTDRYPEVSFLWNEYDPVIKDSTQFKLSANGTTISATVKNLPYNDTITTPKTVLFLVEDLNHTLHGEQTIFSLSVIYHFLTEGKAGKDDRFNVAAFDRKGGNDYGTSIHTWLSNGFTDNRERLATALYNYETQYDLFSNQQNSELYMAIEEGIDALAKEPSDRVRAIVVFTAGSNLDNYGGKNSIDEARAQSLKIPIYVVKYPINGCQHCTNIDLICQKTYGQQVTTNDIERAANSLQVFINTMSKRHHGQDYSITFRSPFPRDGKQHTIILSINGKEQPLTFTAPSLTLRTWIAEHRTTAILCTFGLLLIILLIVWLIIRMTKKRKREMEALKDSQQAVKQEAERLRREMEESQRRQQEEANRQKAEQQLQSFLKTMQVKHLNPRLKYTVGGVTEVYPIKKPVIIIGRDADNDLRLTNDSVSRQHARLTFNGAAFEIENLSATNKLKLNGKPTDRATLKPADVITLGEVVLYYYE
jgi:Sec-independent protein translocase protein TatA